MSEKTRVSQVETWVRSTNRTLNDALRSIPRLNRDSHFKPEEIGFQRIGDRLVFTAISYCEDVSAAYFFALAQEFPFINKFELAAFYLGDGAIHTVLKPTIEETALTIDGAYGQVVGKPNQVAIRRWRNFDRIYHPLQMNDESLQMLMKDYQRGRRAVTQVDHKVVLARLSRRIKTVDQYPIDPAEHRTVNYLVERLLGKQ